MVHRQLIYIYLLNVPSFSSRYFNKIKQTSRLGRLLALLLEILYKKNHFTLGPAKTPQSFGWSECEREQFSSGLGTEILSSLTILTSSHSNINGPSNLIVWNVLDDSIIQENGQVKYTVKPVLSGPSKEGQK